MSVPKGAHSARLTRPVQKQDPIVDSAAALLLAQAENEKDKDKINTSLSSLASSEIHIEKYQFTTPKLGRILLSLENSAAVAAQHSLKANCKTEEGKLKLRFEIHFYLLPIMRFPDSHVVAEKSGAQHSFHGLQVHDLSVMLHEHTWFGFDLDGTLHEFRKASKAASVAVFQHISGYSHVPVEDLSTSYAEVLAQKTASVFTDGKTSDYYRQECFRALLELHSLDAEDDHLIHLANLYKEALEAALEIKPGATNLLRYLRYIGKKIVIITEGPQDAQEWTIEKLGLAEHPDVLVTTNEFGKSKTDGLFGEMLTHLEIEGKDMVYVGDNFQRDVLPAQREGVTTIHFSGAEDVVFERKGMRINSLAMLENILRLKNQGIARRLLPPLSG